MGGKSGEREEEADTVKQIVYENPVAANPKEDQEICEEIKCRITFVKDASD